MIKRLIKKTQLYKFYTIKKNILKQNKNNLKIVFEWEKNGKPLPPPQHYKRTLIKKFAKKYKAKIFVESGTYLGETTDFCSRIFETVYSIELDKTLFEQAKLKFSTKTNIHLLQGDSGKVIEEILKKINSPTIFWLDGHYSEGVTAKGDVNTPILQELTHIFNKSLELHIILIDDARCFNGMNDYPTIKYLRDFVLTKNKNLNFEVFDDIIRIYR